VPGPSDDLRASHVPLPGPVPLPGAATFSEIFAGGGRDAGPVGFALAQVTGNKPLLWVQDRMSILEAGRPFARGIDVPFIHVEARDARAALWAMEEGLKCAALSAVVGEIWGNPKALDFTATRRLAVAAERGGVPALLLLFGAAPNLSGARMRWHASSRPSPPHPHDALAPGAPAWTLELFKARGAHPGRWDVAHEADGLRLLAAPGDGQLAEAGRRRA
jgi:protein ImuA